jgi:virulence-associated protein VapD
MWLVLEPHKNQISNLQLWTQLILQKSCQKKFFFKNSLKDLYLKRYFIQNKSSVYHAEILVINAKTLHKSINTIQIFILMASTQLLTQIKIITCTFT